MIVKKNSSLEDSSLLERKPLKEEIFDVLHKRVIAGKYAPGEWLRQEEISTQLGVSQTPVREALDLLVSSGLVERIPYRGVRVLQLTTQEIVEAYGMRLLLESTIAPVSAQNRTQEQINNLYELLERTQAHITLNDMSIQMQLNREFHLAIVTAGGNALVTRLYEIVSHQFPDWMLYEYMFRYPELLQPSLSNEYDEHKAIVDAVAAQDSEQAAINVASHIINLGKELVGFLGIPQSLLAEKEEQMMAHRKIN